MKMKNLLLLSLIFSLLTVKAQQINIIPKPLETTVNEGVFTLNKNTQIIYEKGLQKEAQYLCDILGAPTGWDLKIKEDNKVKKNAICLSLNNSLSDNSEAYSLYSTNKCIVIKGRENAGVFYGIQTLLQLLPPSIYNKVRQHKDTWTLPCVTIEDAPREQWRGMMLDVARYFFDIKFIKKYVDMMAMYKLNKLQLHLVDDSGWRLEIKKYPRLTEVGAWAGKGSQRLGGYYTQEEIKDLVKYAALRNVEIIPEIEFPAHVLSAIVAYPWLSCREKQLELPIQHFISRDLLCPGKESTFEFLENVFKEVIDLFPSKYINIGGDEAVYTNWEKCPKCQALKKKLGLKNIGDLQGYMTNRIIKFLKKYDRTVVGWEEIAKRGKLVEPVVGVVWHHPNGAQELIDDGNYAILSPNDYYYFDFPESNNPGQVKAATWRGPNSVENVYSLKFEDNKKLLGVQGCFWSDQFIHGTSLQEIDILNENRSENYCEYLTFPRLLALSEAGWSIPANRNYKNFAERLLTHYARLDAKDCNYCVPMPTIVSIKKTTNGYIYTLKSSALNSVIRYTTDGSFPHEHSKIYTTPVTVKNKSDFRAITLMNSRHYSIPTYTKEKYSKEMKLYGQLLGEWTPKTIKDKTFSNLHLDATGKITGNGSYEVTFIYTEGETKLEIESVKLLKRKELLSSDKHKGETGSKQIKNKYLVKIDNSFEAGTPFYIDASVRGDINNNSKGIVFIKKIK